MTNNQLTYQRNLETERANRAAEEHNRRSLAESVRHNQASEGISWNSLAESIRHNKSSEHISLRNLMLGYDQLSETRRHNQAGENISLKQLAESQRHNYASEFNGADWLHLLLNPDWAHRSAEAFEGLIGDNGFWKPFTSDEMWAADQQVFNELSQGWENYLDFIDRLHSTTHPGSSGREHGGWSWGPTTYTW